jgi:D-glycero-alpha-D-manno-heptose-7-phosphate kinase
MLVVSKSPVRISYAGGGSDYQEFFKNEKSFVVNAAISKFVYFFSLPQWPLAEDKYRFTYRHTESVSSYSQIEHPVISRLLKNMNWDTPLNMSTMADVPGQSGLGSSSAFTAAAIQNLNFRNGVEIKNQDLAKATIELERFQLNESGGWQDQLATAIGGLQGYSFSGNQFDKIELQMDSDQTQYLESHQMLLATNFQRVNASSSNFLNSNASGELKDNLKRSSMVAEQLINNLKNCNSAEQSYNCFVNAVNEHWNLKKLLPIESEFQSLLQEKLEILDSFGVDAFKLLGSGNGGYILVLADPAKLTEIENYFGISMCTRFNFEPSGTATRVVI